MPRKTTEQRIQEAIGAEQLEERERARMMIEQRIREVQRSLRHHENQATACKGALQELARTVAVIDPQPEVPEAVL